MVITRSEAEVIAEGLVSVRAYPGRRVWMVYFGLGIDQYQLMYDTEEVASSIAQALKDTIIQGIIQANKLQERY